MPLAKGSSDEIIGKNISELMSTDKYPQKQAIAIALKSAGKSKYDAVAVGLTESAGGRFPTFIPSEMPGRYASKPGPITASEAAEAIRRLQNR